MTPSSIIRPVVAAAYRPIRPAWAAYWRRQLGLARRAAGARRTLPVTALVRVRNEDVWIETILRTVAKVYPQIVVVDNGSEDQTIAIVEGLIRERIGPIRFIRYRDPWRNDSLVLNEILNHVVEGEWFHIVDGDELLLERDYRRIVEVVSGPGLEGLSRILLHARYLHPDRPTEVTKPAAEGVRTGMGRLYRTDEIRIYEPGFRDYPLMEPGNKPLAKEHRTFLRDVFFLHACFTQRSSLKSWQGWASVDPGHREHRLKRYYSPDPDAYETIREFPKELNECRLSPPNPYRDRLAQAGVSFV